MHGPVQFQALALSINKASCVAGMGSNSDDNFNSIFDNASTKTGNQAQIGLPFDWIDFNKMDGYGIKECEIRENGIN